MPRAKRAVFDHSPCSVQGCERAAICRTWCATHYARWQRHGDPTAMLVRLRGQGKKKKVYIYKRNGKKNELAHRLVVEQRIGRPLRSDESVHHKNGDTRDNRTENLELWSRGQPSGQRVEDKVEWARQLLALYQPEPEWIGAGC